MEWNRRAVHLMYIGIVSSGGTFPVREADIVIEIAWRMSSMKSTFMILLCNVHGMNVSHMGGGEMDCCFPYQERVDENIAMVVLQFISHPVVPFLVDIDISVAGTVVEAEGVASSTKDLMKMNPLFSKSRNR